MTSVTSSDTLRRSGEGRLPPHAAFARYRVLKAEPATSATRPTLSTREIQCLRALANGKTDVEAAKELGITRRTVRFHIDSAKAKLGVDTRVQAVAKALLERIVG